MELPATLHAASSFFFKPHLTVPLTANVWNQLPWLLSPEKVTRRGLFACWPLCGTGYHMLCHRHANGGFSVASLNRVCHVGAAKTSDVVVINLCDVKRAVWKAANALCSDPRHSRPGLDMVLRAHDVERGYSSRNVDVEGIHARCCCRWTVENFPSQGGCLVRIHVR